MGINPDEKYFPTKEDIESVRRIFAAKKYNIEKIWAAGYEPEEDDAWGNDLPELQLWISFDGKHGSRWTLNTELSKRLSRSALGQKYIIYVLSYASKVLETDDNEASKIPDGVVQVWPLADYGKSVYDIDGRRKYRYTQDKTQMETVDTIA